MIKRIILSILLLVVMKVFAQPVNLGKQYFSPKLSVSPNYFSAQRILDTGVLPEIKTHTIQGIALWSASTSNGTVKILDSLINYSYSSGHWVKSFKSAFTYDASTNLTIAIYSNWDRGIQEWVYAFKDEYTYDNNGNIILVLDYEWDRISNQWKNKYKYEFTYNAFGYDYNIVSKWNTSSNQWEYLYKEEYTYYSNGKVRSNTNSQWNTSAGQWVLNYKYEYFYDTNDRLETRKFYFWNTNSNQWNRNYKIEYSYDTNGNLSVRTRYSWDNNAGQWVYYKKYEYTYTGNGRINTLISYVWQRSYSQWENSYRNLFSYDANGNLITNLYYEWNPNTQQWDKLDKYNYTYNLSVDISDVIWPSGMKNFYPYVENQLLEMIRYLWNSSNNVWENYKKQTFFYSERAVPVDKIMQNRVAIYPNPVSDYVYFKFKEPLFSTARFSLFDARGQLIILQKVSESKTLDLRDLDAGVYFYILQTDAGIQRGKLIKR